ncbi:MAG: hypothetical protein PHW75_03375 [Patescibacteria group bacterium]|nr:hypothetical protein [Patescibacteria group bacterium]
MKRLIYILTTIIIIFLAGYLTYWGLTLTNSKRIRLADEYMHEYEVNHNLSHLYQTFLLDPTRVKAERVVDKLLTEKMYEEADLFNYMYNLDSYHLKAAIFAVENYDFKAAKGYLDNIQDINSRREIENFIDFAENGTPVIVSKPVTPLGQQMKFLANLPENYQIPEIDSKIGRILRAELNADLNNSEATLKTAIIYNELGFSNIALYTLDNLDGCLTDKYVLKAQIYESREDYKGALENIELALGCNVTNEELYVLAIDYAENSGDTAKTQYLKKRLEYLQNLAK